MSPLYNPLATDELKRSLARAVRAALGTARGGRRGSAVPDGRPFSVADGYAFYVLRAWQRSAKQDLSAWPGLVAYYERLVARPSIAASLAAEGIAP